MNIARFALDNSRIVQLFALFIALAGIFLFQDYPKQEDPSIRIREAVVTALYPGMSPQRIEDLVTRKLEEKIREIPEIKDIISESKSGVATIHVVARDEVSELDPVWQKLRNRMDDIRQELPDGTQGPFVNDEFGLTAVSTIALLSDGFSLAEMREAARDMRDQLYSLKGVKRIELFGVQEERIFVELSNAKLAKFGITPEAIGNTLSQQNTLLPGGDLTLSGRSFVIEPSGNYQDLADIASTPISIPGTESSIQLRDLAEITRDYIDPLEKPVYFNGEPSIILSISVMDSVDAVAFGTQLKTRVEQIEEKLPWGLSLEFATFQPELIEKAVSGAVVNLGQTVLIVLAVVILALGLRTGLIVGSFVPLVMLFGMVGMSFFDIELQRISIASMIIALGMLVDNGIVVAEDIRTRMQAGTGAREAAIATGQSLTIPLMTSSLTTVLAFMPLMLMVGAAGEYTGSLSYVIGILMIGSWLLAMLIVPLVSVHFMKVTVKHTQDADRFEHGVYKVYRRMLTWMLSHRLLVLILVVLALVGSGWMFGNLVVKEFFPKGERSQYLVYLDMPAGTRSDAVAERLDSINNWLLDPQQNPEVTNTVAYIGHGGPRFFLSLAPLDPDPHKAFMLVNLDNNSQVPGLIQRTHHYLLDHYPEVRAKVKAMWMGPTETGLYEVRISGTSGDLLIASAERIMAGLHAIPGTIDVLQNWDTPVVKFKVDIDQSRARRAGVTSTDVANSLNNYMDGIELTDYREGDTVIPIIARGKETERALVSNLWELTVFSASTGKSVSLGQIADFNGQGQYSRIKRRNQIRTVTIQGKHPRLKAAQLHQRMRPILDQEESSLPAGYFIELGGELEGSSEAQGHLATWMPLAFALIFALIVWQFNSIRRAAVIMLTIPLIIVGATIGLVTMKAVFGFMTILGLLAVAGIIINNGIVMIDRIEEERLDGTEPYEAVIRSALSRFRPILLSVFTTVLGLLPLIIYQDILFYGMASMMAFALVIGTVLTLGVVPVLYTLFLNVKPPRLG
ncbi:MAG: efflux RND transporter permease subunit [Candidatus Thiodiazotropha lotti]|nr:efflux RND transporter permease subunit [Candidatus Thiodiazotropha lotti]